MGESMGGLDADCFAILDDVSLFEEDKVDKIEEIVTQRFPNMSSQQLERIIMDIMWRHKDPSRAEKQLPRVVKVEEREMKVDIPSFERRVQLQKQYMELQEMEEKSKKKEFTDLLHKTQELSKELYGENEQGPPCKNAPPIDQLSELFNHTVTKARIQQALKSTGYHVIDAANLILTQLKGEEGGSASRSEERFFESGKNLNIVCSFFTKNGKCLKSDCQFRHDVDQRTCSFWLKGRCLAGDNCMFQHSLGELLTAIPTPPSTSSDSVPSDQKPKSKFDIEIPTFVPSYSAIPIRLPLRKPKAIPWESDDSIFERYIHHRKCALRAEDLRKKFARTSTEAWKNNDGLKSKQYSTKASQQDEKYFDALKLADDELAKYSDTLSDEVWYEMHGLDFSDAVEQLNSSLQEVRNKSSRNSKTVFIIVPSSFDYSQYKKTTKPITIWLDHEGYRWDLHSCGNGNMGSVIAIDPWSR
jgi:hypothetical protein